MATPASVSQIVGLDRNGRNELTLVDTTLPIAIGIAGAVALAAGILLARRPRPDTAVRGDVTPAVTGTESGR